MDALPTAAFTSQAQLWVSWLSRTESKAVERAHLGLSRSQEDRVDPPASSQDPFFMLSPPKWGLLESSWLSCFSPASSHSSNVQAVLHLPPPLLTAIALPSFLPSSPPLRSHLSCPAFLVLLSVGSLLPGRFLPVVESWSQPQW